jgi:hypothetical protein
VSLPGRKRRSRLSGKSLAGQSILRDCTYVFDIAFISGEAPYVGAGGWSGSWALIVLGEFKEHFVAPTGSWRPTDYETQWLDGAHRLIDGARESCFVAEAGRLWWTAWREGARILVQQRLLVADSMAPGRNATAANLPYELIGPRRTRSDDNQPVSEWSVTVSDLVAFVNRRPRPPAG